MKCKEDLVPVLINLMLKKYNRDFNYIQNHSTIQGKPWYEHFTLTKEEFSIFKKEAINLIKINFKCSKSYAAKIFIWFNLFYGLTIQDN